MNHLSNLYLNDHKEFIEGIISKYIDADLVFAESRNDIGNRIGLSKWGYPNIKDRILLPKTISVTEQLSVILAMGARENTYNNSKLSGHANKLLSSDSMFFLEHLVLHEIAHIKNKWDQKKEIDCDIWAFERLNTK